MRKLLLTFVVVVLMSITANAQNMLGATYNEVRNNYTSQRKIFTDWEEGINKNGIFNVSYRHKEPNYFMLYFFENGKVVKYVIADTESRANTYAKAFNNEFVPVNTNTWIDYSADCTWELFLEDGMVYLEAHLIEKD
jgi:hypothetical protein